MRYSYFNYTSNNKKTRLSQLISTSFPLFICDRFSSPHPSKRSHKHAERSEATFKRKNCSELWEIRAIFATINSSSIIENFVQKKFELVREHTTIMYLSVRKPPRASQRLALRLANCRVNCILFQILFSAFRPE